MDVQIEPSWKQHLAPEFEKPYFVKLTNFVRQEYRTTTCYPPGKLIFNAFNSVRMTRRRWSLSDKTLITGRGRRMACVFR